MTLRDEFEDLWPIPNNVIFDEPSQEYRWRDYPNTTSPVNDMWESFCDGARVQQRRVGESPALDIEEFIAAKKYYTTIANPEEMDGTESVSVAELREFMHRRVATASPQAAVPEDLRASLFSGWQGCSNHGCIVRGAQKGMGTNGQCKCLVDASRTQLQMLQGRLQSILAHKERTECLKEQ